MDICARGKAMAVRSFGVVLVLGALHPLLGSAGVSRYVDPFIGTSANGHVNPGAARPFSFVKPGPDTGNGSWDYCGGYRHEDETLDGFSQTHLSGVGRAEMGDVLLLPFVGGEVRRKVSFAHDGEIATPGYYAVTTDGGKVRAEMTSTRCVAFHRFTYHEGPARLLVDLQHGITSVKALVHTHVISNACAFGADGRSLCGTTRVRKNWPEHDYSFVIRFDRPLAAKTLLPPEPGEKGPRYLLDFDLRPGETLQVKVAFSMNSTEKAADNLQAEIPGWDFDAVRKAAAEEWEALLSRVALKTDDETQLRTFYTALYHSFLHPDEVSDAGEPPRYSTFSLWDTFRAAHPLFTLLAPERVNGFVTSILAHSRKFGYLPIWMMWGREGHCMIGNHAVPVLLDAWRKGFHVDLAEAYAAVRESLLVDHADNERDDWEIYEKFGYYPYDLVPWDGVSRTYECAFDDWCAAQMAEALGRTDEVTRFLRRAGSWQNVFDPSIGFARGRKADGSWRTPFKASWYCPPKEQGGGWRKKDFTEGNGWQYTFHVLHDVPGLVDAFGGKDRLLKRLDELFVDAEDAGEGCKDASGRIGQYAHGNEPCHHVPYLYALLGERDKTVACVDRICRTLYGDRPDGLCGNDDCGQMSAWYVFATLGFYPYNPASGEYVLGAPRVPEATVALPGGKRLRIVAKGLSKEADGASAVTLNGKPLMSSVVRHEDLLQGGELVFGQDDCASKTGPQNVPDLLTTEKGERVRDATAWEKVRKPEILEFFRREVYGRRPVQRPPHLEFSSVAPDRVMMDGAAVRKRIRVEYGGSHGTNSFVFTAFVPTAAKRPVPSFVFICNRDPKENIDPERVNRSGFWPAEEIVRRGFAAIAFFNGDVTPDIEHGRRLGAFAAFEDVDRKYRSYSGWGVLSCWAWGASRVLDWIETEPLLDARHVAVIGHSRGGKTALVAAAEDPRFAMACSSCSGCGGAKLHHIDLPASENILRSNVSRRFWYCNRYVEWTNRDREMPYDQHEYVALIAPRLVCIGSATDDDQAGPLGEYWTARLASPAWALYGKRGLVTEAWPDPDVPQQEGSISYHRRTGKHDLAPYDWNVYMDFAERHGWLGL